MNRTMRFMVLVVGLLACSVMGQKNWNGYGDTLVVNGFNGTETHYTAAEDLSAYEDIAVVVLADDTTQAGFASDSGVARYGYQLGYLVYNSSGSRDTLWWPVSGVTLDTLNLLDSAGTNTAGAVTASGTVTDYLGDVDTSYVSGYAAQVCWFVPKWAPLIRYWVTGMTGNLGTTPLVWRFCHLRRLRTVTSE